MIYIFLSILNKAIYCKKIFLKSATRRQVPKTGPTMVYVMAEIVPDWLGFHQ
jgi:hypothetical protein